MIIYKTTNLVNGKIYIGRDKRNKPSYYGSGKIYLRAEKKYGKENFIKEILEDNIESIEKLNEREKYWIAFFNATDTSIGYNIQKGGQGGDWYALTPEQQAHIKKRISETHKGHIKSKETVEKMRKSMKGKNTGKRPDWVCKKISEATKGNNLGRKPWHAGKTGVYTEETIKKLKAAAAGENNPMYGKTHSAESKQLMSNVKKGKPSPFKNTFQRRYIFFKNNVIIHIADGQANAIRYCRETKLPYSTLIKKLLSWKEYKIQVIN